MLYPKLSGLLEGCLREALAHMHSIALYGRQSTRDWSGPQDYVVDDNEGDTAIVRFVAGNCAGAMHVHDPSRKFEPSTAISLAPIERRHHLADLCELPFFQGPHSHVTALFWSEHDAIRGSEPWDLTCRFGAEVLERELMNESAWRLEAAEYYGFWMDIAELIVAIVKRARSEQTTELKRAVGLREQESAVLIPTTAPHYRAAVDALLSSGVFFVLK